MNNTILTILVLVSLGINVFLIHIVDKLYNNMLTLTGTVSSDLIRLTELQQDILKCKETELRTLECIETNTELIDCIFSELTLLKTKGGTEDGGEQ